MDPETAEMIRESEERRRIEDEENNRRKAVHRAIQDKAADNPSFAVAHAILELATAIGGGLDDIGESIYPIAEAIEELKPPKLDPWP